MEIHTNKEEVDHKKSEEHEIVGSTNLVVLMDEFLCLLVLHLTTAC
jgi:hypothetical protein